MLSKQWAVFDIDGVLADCSGREHLAAAARGTQAPAERDVLWRAFHGGCEGDPAHVAELLLAKAWMGEGHGIIFLTGRPEYVRPLTVRWLLRMGLPGAPLFMRPEGNYTTSSAFKREAMGRIRTIIGPLADIAFVMEDNDHVVKALRADGLTVLQPRSQAY